MNTPFGDVVCRQRATSPSLQSQSICICPRSAARTAPGIPGISRANAALAPVATMSQVTPLAVIGVFRSSRVRYGEMRRW